MAERKDVLSTLFGLLTLLMYANYAKQSRIQNPKAKVAFGLALVFFAFSLMSKPMLVTLPLLLLLLDYWPLDRFSHTSAWKLAREKIPFLLLTIASCAVTFIAQKRGGAMALMAGVPLMVRVENVPVSYCRYLGKLLWPENLAVIYPIVNHWPVAIWFICVTVLLTISTVSIVTHRNHPYLVTGWFWFVGTLVPVIGLVAVGEQAMADRYTYVPLVGVLIIVAWGAEDMTHLWRYRIPSLSAVSVAIIVSCVLLTRQNIGYWRSSETLFRHVIAISHDNYSAHCNLGNSLIGQGRLEEALGEFQTAAKLKPDSPENHCNLGVALADMDRLVGGRGGSEAKPC